MSLSDDDRRLSLESQHSRPSRPGPRSTSPSSSLSSLMSAGSILPAPPSNSSQSDIVYMDSSEASSGSKRPARASPQPANVAFPVPRPSSRLADVVRTQRSVPAPLRITTPPTPPFTPHHAAPAVPTPRLTAGQKLKKVFGRSQRIEALRLTRWSPANHA